MSFECRGRSGGCVYLCGHSSLVKGARPSPVKSNNNNNRDKVATILIADVLSRGALSSQEQAGALLCGVHGVACRM